MAECGIFFSDEVDVCPYNPSHSILRTRMQTHLVKCRKGHNDTEKKLCPFNSTHHIDAPEFSYHITVCPDRRTLDNFKYTLGPETLPENILPVENREIPCDENWDEVDVPTYDPALRLQDGNLLVQIKGATPSERKKFREERRQRFVEDNAIQQKEDGPFDVEIIEPVSKSGELPANEDRNWKSKEMMLANNKTPRESKRSVSEMNGDVDYENAAWGWQSPRQQERFECEESKLKAEKNWTKYNQCDKYLKYGNEQKEATAINFDCFLDADFQPVYGQRYNKLSRVDRQSSPSTTDNSSNFQYAYSRNNAEENGWNHFNESKSENYHPGTFSKNNTETAQIYINKGDTSNFLKNFNGQTGNNARSVGVQENYYSRQGDEINVTRVNSTGENSVSNIGRGFTERQQLHNFGRGWNPMVNNTGGHYQLECKGRGSILQRQTASVGQQSDFRLPPPPLKPMSPSKRWGEYGSFESLASTWRDKVTNAQPSFEMNNTSWPVLQETRIKTAPSLKQNDFFLGPRNIRTYESNFDNQYNNQARKNFACTSTEEATNFHPMPFNHEERILLKTPSDFEVTQRQQNCFTPISPAASNGQMHLLSPSAFSLQSATTTSGLESVYTNDSYGAAGMGRGCSVDRHAW